jgi:hypothetical protein
MVRAMGYFDGAGILWLSSKQMSNLPAATDWICPSCQHANSPLEYCPVCGERRLNPHRLTLMGIAEQAMESLFHGDARIPRTLKALVSRPGRITQAWAHGERRGWMAPFQLFLFLNVVFFLVQAASGISVLFTPLDKHLHNMAYAPVAQKLMDSHLDRHGGTVAQLTPSFEHQEKINAKLLVLAMVPALALVLRLTFPSRRGLGAIHVVFALHFYAYLMICVSLLYLLAAAPAGLLIHRFGTSISSSIGNALSLLEIALVVIYLWPALGRVYSLTRFSRFASVVLLTAAIWPILMTYRLLVYWVTLHEI